MVQLGSSASASRMKAEPMKPAPPVTKRFFMIPHFHRVGVPSQGNTGFFEQLAEHLVRVEKILGDGACRPAVPVVVAGDLVRAINGLFERPKRDQALADG